ncbi:MAG TPA: MBL fold metallo-hydrolase [Methylomirabilota bacterium]|nr:MBL fold metallo-hydrolase [Methylomirabilota bacterium]
MHFTFLGTSAAIPSLQRDTTWLAFSSEGELLLVDCGGSPLQKLQRAKCHIAHLSRIVVTHVHPDHAYGLPALIQNLMIQKRRAPLMISCRVEHLERLQSLLDLFGLLDREKEFPILFETVEPREGIEVARTPTFILSASPNAHGAMPNLAVRIDLRSNGRAVVYSSDTEPCEAVIRLSRGADTLIHEATFSSLDPDRSGAHSTARQAGEVAQASGVKQLILTHIDPRYHNDPSPLIREAREAFSGELLVAEEFRQYQI